MDDTTYTFRVNLSFDEYQILFCNALNQILQSACKIEPEISTDVNN